MVEASIEIGADPIGRISPRLYGTLAEHLGALLLRRAAGRTFVADPQRGGGSARMLLDRGQDEVLAHRSVKSGVEHAGR